MAASASSYVPTGSRAIDGVLTGLRWSTTELTYSFPDSRSSYEQNYYDGAAIQSHLTQLTGEQQAAVGQVLTQIESFTNLTFTDVTDTGIYPDLRYALSREPATAFAYYPSSNPVGGDSFYNAHRQNFDNVKLGSYGFMTFMHETGHTLGLKHGHAAAGGFSSLPRKLDSHEFSVMTYREYVRAPANKALANEKFGFSQSFMMLDIAALQELYGANYNHNSDDTVYAFNPSTGRMTINGVGLEQPGANRIFLTIWDGGGEDTYDLSNYGSNLVIRLEPGSWSRTKKGQLADLDQSGDHHARGNIYNALLHNDDERSLIENAIGGKGHDRIIGNSTDNTLVGNRGSDKLFGRDGDDVLSGGVGRDKLFGDNGSDTIGGDGGRDAVIGGNDDDTLTGGGGRDKLVGGNGNDVICGGSGRDKLFGGNGNDIINGGGARDFLWGDAGADTFRFGSLTDSAATWRHADVIKDFSRAQGDIVDLTNLATNEGVAIQIIGEDPFSGSPGELRLSKEGFAIDMDGDRTADFVVKFANLKDKLQADDFLV